VRIGAALTLGFALLVVRSTLLPMVGLSAIGPDLVFPLVVFFAASGRFGQAFVLAVVLGHLADLMGGSAHGIHLFLYSLGFVISSSLAGRLDLQGTTVPCLVVLCVSLLSGFGLWLLYGLWSLPMPAPAGGLLAEAALTALFAVPLLPVLRALQQIAERDGNLVLPR